MNLLRLAFVTICLALVTSCDSDTTDGGASQYDAASISIADFRTFIVGEWVSVTDSKSVLSFDNSGLTMDIYASEQKAQGTWNVVNEVTSPTGLVLTKTEDSETYTYAVLAISMDELTLSYLPRGNTLKYRRQK